MASDDLCMYKDKLLRALIDVICESWRLSKSYRYMIGKYDVLESHKHISRLDWFDARIRETAVNAGLRIVELEGVPYDAGVAATPINIGDFDASDELVIDNVILPTLIDEKGIIVHHGTISLKRK